MDGISLGIAKSGDVVFIECDKSISPTREAKIRSELATALESSGVKGVLLPPGLRVARMDDKPSDDAAGPRRRIGFIQ